MSLTKASPEELISGQRHRWFYVACAAEASLVPVAAILGYFFVTRLGPTADGTDRSLVGLVAGLPPFVLFLGMLKSRSEALPMFDKPWKRPCVPCLRTGPFFNSP